LWQGIATVSRIERGLLAAQSPGSRRSTYPCDDGVASAANRARLASGGAMRNLSIGTHGQDVVALQQGLNQRRTAQDTALQEDGIFGPKTGAAVRRFQSRNNLQVDGIVGPITRNAIFPLGVVTIRAYGWRLLNRPLFRSAFGLNPVGSGPLLTPPQQPSISGYQPLAYPLLPMPIQSPLLSPAPLLPITIP